MVILKSGNSFVPARHSCWRKEAKRGEKVKAFAKKLLQQRNLTLQMDADIPGLKSIV